MTAMLSADDRDAIERVTDKSWPHHHEVVEVIASSGVMGPCSELMAAVAEVVRTYGAKDQKPAAADAALRSLDRVVKSMRTHVPKAAKVDLASALVEVVLSTLSLPEESRANAIAQGIADVMAGPANTIDDLGPLAFPKSRVAQALGLRDLTVDNSDTHRWAVKVVKKALRATDMRRDDVDNLMRTLNP